MNNNNIRVSILTLTKNDNQNFLRTLRSIEIQTINYKVEWLIIDGSDNINFEYREIILSKFKKKSINNKFFLRHIKTNNLKIKGIYPCMNYGKKIAKGDAIIFLNSGDEFHNKSSLNNLASKAQEINNNYFLIFGQAKIIASKKITWYFPGNKLKNIDIWLKFFEPNHQSMLISKKLAQKYDFDNKYNMIADGYWKKKIIKESQITIYIQKPICNFYLDGISSSKISFTNFKQLILNNNLSIIRKIIFTFKLVIPGNIFFIYHHLQKIKSLLIDYLF